MEWSDLIYYNDIYLECLQDINNDIYLECLQDINNDIYLECLQDINLLFYSTKILNYYLKIIKNHFNFMKKVLHSYLI